MSDEDLALASVKRLQNRIDEAVEEITTIASYLGAQANDAQTTNQIKTVTNELKDLIKIMMDENE